MLYARSSLTARPVAAPRSSVRIAPVRPSVMVRADPGDELKQGARDIGKNVSCEYQQQLDLFQQRLTHRKQRHTFVSFTSTRCIAQLPQCGFLRPDDSYLGY